LQDSFGCEGILGLLRYFGNSSGIFVEMFWRDFWGSFGEFWRFLFQNFLGVFVAVFVIVLRDFWDF